MFVNKLAEIQSAPHFQLLFVYQILAHVNRRLRSIPSFLLHVGQPRTEFMHLFVLLLWFCLLYFARHISIKIFFPCAVTASQPPQRPWIPLSHPERNKPIGKKHPFQSACLGGSHIQIGLSLRIVISLIKKIAQTLVFTDDIQQYLIAQVKIFLANVLFV